MWKYTFTWPSCDYINQLFCIKPRLPSINNQVIFQNHGPLEKFSRCQISMDLVKTISRASKWFNHRSWVPSLVNSCWLFFEFYHFHCQFFQACPSYTDTSRRNSGNFSITQCLLWIPSPKRLDMRNPYLQTITGLFIYYFVYYNTLH